MVRFNEATLEVLSANSDVKINALAQGLQDGDLFRSLAKKAPKIFDDLLTRVEKYINLEEDTHIKKKERSSERRKDERSSDKKKEDIRSGGRRESNSRRREEPRSECEVVKVQNLEPLRKRRT